jgi:cysteine desulfurase family protein (TIGR01976 family)
MSDAPASAASVAPIAIDRIRAAFPALARRYHGLPVAYFDGPGGTQTPGSVVDAVAEYLLHHNANTHWRYPTSQETDETIAGARAALADFVNASPDEIVFGANMTTMTFHLARALARGWQAGDEIVVTELDHHANVDPWRAAAADRGLTVRAVRIDPSTGELDWNDLQAALTPKTRLLAIGAASNALGTVNDVTRASALAHAAGALVFVDGVHYAPHTLADVQAIDCDFFACSAYKFYGPHIGVLYGRRHLIEALNVPKLQPAPESSPERLETGTQNHEGMAGARAAVDFLASLASFAPGVAGAEAGAGASRRAALVQAFDALHVEGERLLARLYHGLSAIDGVRVYGRTPDLPRTPTVGFTVAGVSTDAVADALAQRAVFVSNGDFYAATVVKRMNLTGGLVRAGCACYTTTEEVDRLIDGVRALRA